VINHYILFQDIPIAELSKKGVEHCNKVLEKGYQPERVIFLAAVKWRRQSGGKDLEGFETREQWLTGVF